MKSTECFINCIVVSDLLPTITCLATITTVCLILFIIKRRYESLLASQTFMSMIITLSLFSMKCNMFTWIWIYLGIILIGTILMSIAKQYIDLQLSRNIVTSIPCLSEIKQQFKINIHIIDTQKIKAFTHRKKIYLSVGLLERLNDDELKAVVAHEIYHLKHSPNKFLSSLLALASLTFRRFNDEHSADRYAAKTAGIHNLINALRKLEIKNYKERARRLYLES